MKKNNKVMSAIAIGAVGVLALGACSSGNGQAQGDREAEAATISPSASGSPTLKVPNLTKNPHFIDVSVTHALPANCKIDGPNDTNTMNIECENVLSNYLGDQVFIRVPSNKFRVVVNRESSGPMTVTQRDYAYVKLRDSKDAKTVWNSPYTDKVQQENLYWGVGMNTLQGKGKGKFHATVTYLGN